MIYLSDDYFTKYIDSFSYLISRASYEGYSLPYIEKVISYSSFINELERSNITTIAFTSMEKLYYELFPKYENNLFDYDPYNIYAWVSYIYFHLFLEFQITFELIFIILPIEDMLNLYKVYHEMDYKKMYEVFKSRVPYSYLDNIMKKKGISSNELSIISDIPFSTINALRYNKRNIAKLEVSSLFKIAKALNIKTESLLVSLELDIEE